MLFDFIAFLDFRWLVAFHLCIAALILGPFIYIWLREQIVTKDRDEG
ncbi:MAG: hypothetical protein AAF281_00485 [Pseudomonadota bacterium]